MDSIVDVDPNVSNLLQQAEAINRGKKTNDSPPTDQQLELLGESIETFKKHSEQIKENFKKFIKEKKDQVSNEINRYNETLENIRNGISETSMPIDYDKQYEENFNSIDEGNLL
ncbi:hypothetical protein ACTFIY_004723 [Dictyostelium cf. discoideum]